jgi:hypothetical protein
MVVVYEWRPPVARNGILYRVASFTCSAVSHQPSRGTRFQGLLTCNLDNVFLCGRANGGTEGRSFKCGPPLCDVEESRRTGKIDGGIGGERVGVTLEDGSNIAVTSKPRGCSSSMRSANPRTKQKEQGGPRGGRRSCPAPARIHDGETQMNMENGP